MAVAASHRDVVMDVLHYKDPTQNESGTGKTAYIDVDSNTRRSPEFQLGDGTPAAPSVPAFHRGAKADRT